MQMTQGLLEWERNKWSSFCLMFLIQQRRQTEQEMTVIRSSTPSPAGLFPRLYHLDTERKQWVCDSDSWHFMYFLLILVLINTCGHINQHSVLYCLVELRPSSLISPFVPFTLCLSVFLTLTSCQPVIITVRYRLSFSPSLPTSHMHPHTQHTVWDGDETQVSAGRNGSHHFDKTAQRDTIPVILLSLCLWKLICCVSVSFASIFKREEEWRVEAGVLCHFWKRTTDWLPAHLDLQSAEGLLLLCVQSSVHHPVTNCV